MSKDELAKWRDSLKQGLESGLVTYDKRQMRYEGPACLIAPPFMADVVGPRHAEISEELMVSWYEEIKGWEQSPPKGGGDA